MKKERKVELPLLCKNCKHRGEESTICAAYAFRVAANNFKAAIVNTIRSAKGKPFKEYNYDCEDYQPEVKFFKGAKK